MAAAALAKTTGKTSAVTLTGSRSRTAYKLGQEIGAGGNGIVYAVSLRPELVAKVARQPLTRHDVEKLEALVAGTTADLVTVAAWPVDCLADASGRTVGFVMPRILDARPLHELYSPRPRVQHFPAADFRFLVHVAANVARLFAAVHKAGFICGDVNHSNILIRQNGTVAAVDCDSFQVGDGKRFPCLVGTDGFVPPELLGAALGHTPRNANHDNYGLALLVFHLLFMGRHPFAGRFLGRGEMPLERAIAEGRFAYSRDARRTELAPPPFTLPMAAVGPAVSDLFERAFHPDARKGGRPSPETWIDALDHLKATLAVCGKVAWHHHPQSVTPCPWCAIEGTAKVKLFGGLIRTAAPVGSDFDVLWARYLALADPGPPRPLPKPSDWVYAVAPVLPAQQSPPRKARARRSWQHLIATHGRPLLYLGQGLAMAGLVMLDPSMRPLKAWIAGLVSPYLAPLAPVLEVLTPHAPAAARILADQRYACLAAVLLVLVVSLLGAARASGLAPLRDAGRLLRALSRSPRAVSRGSAARAAWAKAASAWKAQPAPPDVSDLRPAIEQLKKDIDALGPEREARLAAAASPLPEAEQLARYLGQFRIEAARLPNIGTARCAVLRSWGIDTAADIDADRIAEIPGFGKGLTDKLVIWREMREREFKPTSAGIVDPLEVQRIDRQIAARRTALTKELRAKIGELERRIGPFAANRAQLWANVEAALAARMS